MMYNFRRWLGMALICGSVVAIVAVILIYIVPLLIWGVR
jgi:hypothetical protein